jgi:predicted DNA-binding protein
MMGLYLPPNSTIRLKAFSAMTRGGKAVIKIELETEDMNDLGFELDALKRLQAAQAAEVKRKRGRLALPHPDAV